MKTVSRLSGMSGQQGTGPGAASPRVGSCRAVLPGTVYPSPRAHWQRVVRCNYLYGAPRQRLQHGIAAVSSSTHQAEYSMDGLDTVDVDPHLENFEDHLRYRYRQFLDTKASIEAAEGSLLNFAEGYKRYGFNKTSDGIVYREWAPAAQTAFLIGDFNNWQGTPMTKDQWGVWSVTLPPGTIHHNSRVKIKLQHPGGWTLDRVPAWITYAKADPGRMGATYNGIYWDPPADKKYQWKHERPRRPPGLRIYEAHVGMSSEEPKVATYREFKDTVLPRVKSLGYNAIQLMAVQEHVYYASFGYHVTNPFAVASRSGTPEELKELVDEAHRLGILVLLDVVHSHISKNQEDGLAGFDLGQQEGDNYFCGGERGYHLLWDSRCLAYRNWEVLRYLLSNLRWWIEEYQFDGFRFDGVTSMLYHHHGINTGFSGGYHEYFGPQTNTDAVVYLMLANDMVHKLLPQAVTIAEDVSGMPTLCRPVVEGGVGFDYRLAMAVPDMWIKLLKHTRDEHWSVMELVKTLCNRRYSEKTIGYCESHDQAMVGDQTIAWRLIGAEMYTGMSTLTEATPVVERGIALHKMIRAVSMVLGGEGWLAFMGNEFGHPEWLDFPREGNQWSHHYARRQWSLATTDHLRYKFLDAFDTALMHCDQRWGVISSPHQWVTHIDEKEQMLVAERGPLVWVFNFSPTNNYEPYRVAVPEPGKWRVALDSDAWDFGGKGRVGHDVDHFSEPTPTGTSGDRSQSIQVLAPSRTMVAYFNADRFPPPPPPSVEPEWQEPPPMTAVEQPPAPPRVEAAGELDEVEL